MIQMRVLLVESPKLDPLGHRATTGMLDCIAATLPSDARGIKTLTALKQLHIVRT